MRPIALILLRFANHVMVALMAAMFTAFIIQIASRYLFNAPVDWAYEIILITWLWAIFWGSAFLLADKDHVKFDVIYNLGQPRTRRIYALISALGLVTGFLVSVPATYDFISFKSIRSSDMLGIRLDILFSVYLIFLAAIIVHYLLRAWWLIKGEPMEKFEREEF